MKFVIKEHKDKEMLFNYLKDIKTDYVVDVKKKRNNRSNNQNNYYWKCIVQLLSEELGYFPDEMHDILRNKFLSEYEMVEINNNTVGLNKTRGTSTLNTQEFEKYTEQIRIWALTEMSIKIPLPNEY